MTGSSPNTPSITLIPPPPTSTLFPYTTLFRSHGRSRAGSLRECGKPAKRGDTIEHAESRKHLERDRKSTRLNSSHSQISYAVFCLKKKKRVDLPMHSVDLPDRTGRRQDALGSG